MRYGMGNRIYAVIDTNVLVSALLGASKMSTPTQVLLAIVEGKLTPVLNEEILSEYKNVLTREKFSFNLEHVNNILNLLQQEGIKVGRKKSNEYFPDKKDIVFYEVSLSNEGSFLVTGNLKHFPQKSFVVSPAEMIDILNHLESK